MKLAQTNSEQKTPQSFNQNTPIKFNQNIQYIYQNDSKKKPTIRITDQRIEKQIINKLHTSNYSSSNKNTNPYNQQGRFSIVGLGQSEESSAIKKYSNLDLTPILLNYESKQGRNHLGFTQLKQIKSKTPSKFQPYTGISNQMQNQNTSKLQTDRLILQGNESEIIPHQTKVYQQQLEHSAMTPDLPGLGVNITKTLDEEMTDINLKLQLNSIQSDYQTDSLHQVNKKILTEYNQLQKYKINLGLQDIQSILKIQTLQSNKKTNTQQDLMTVQESETQINQNQQSIDQITTFNDKNNNTSLSEFQLEGLFQFQIKKDEQLKQKIRNKQSKRQTLNLNTVRLLASPIEEDETTEKINIQENLISDIPLL